MDSQIRMESKDQHWLSPRAFHLRQMQVLTMTTPLRLCALLALQPRTWVILVALQKLMSVLPHLTLQKNLSRSGQDKSLIVHKGLRTTQVTLTLKGQDHAQCQRMEVGSM